MIRELDHKIATLTNMHSAGELSTKCLVTYWWRQIILSVECLISELPVIVSKLISSSSSSTNFIATQVLKKTSGPLICLQNI